MANTNLGCSAENCTHNNSGKCYAGVISVGGVDAQTTANTCCESFVDRADSSFTNCACGSSCTCTSDINCKAENCKHNENHKCYADDVHINAQDATCETFKC